MEFIKALQRLEERGTKAKDILKEEEDRRKREAEQKKKDKVMGVRGSVAQDLGLYDA